MQKNNINDDFNLSIQIPSAEEFAIFKKKIAPLINLDLTNYKNTQMERRIASLMHRNNINNLMNYYKCLSSDPVILDEFINMLTINVTEFFRNPEKFFELENTYIPELLKKNQFLKIWSAGCSVGAEIYSLAMILDKLKVLDKCDLIASDFDANILKKAQTGIYTNYEKGNLKEEYKKYFKSIDDNDSKFQIDSRIISKVKFEKRDLLNSNFAKNFDLILCRNVVIYFTEDAKEVLYKKIYESLRIGGILFIGSTERINNHKAIGYNLKSSFFYER